MSFQVFQAQGLRIFAGNTATCANYTGNAGEISVNTETKAVYVHDGLTPGGTPLTTAEQAELLGMTLGQLANVELDEPSNGQVLVYDEDAGVWKNELVAGAGGGAVDLDGLNDVDLLNPADNQVLTYNQGLSKWENKEAPQADISNVYTKLEVDSLVETKSDITQTTTASGVKHNRIAVSAVSRHDLRHPSPSQFPNNSVSFAFTTWNWNNSTPYADAIVFSTWSDPSGGAVNCLNISKSSNAMKVSRNGVNSTSKFSSGSIYSISVVSGSDARVKENVQGLEETLPLINQLRPVTFEWTDEYINAGFSRNKDENDHDQNGNRIKPSTKTRNIGLIAQEVEQVIPTVVHEDNLSLPNHEEYLKDVDYEKIVPYLIKAVQELSAKNEELQQRISILEGV